MTHPNHVTEEHLASDTYHTDDDICIKDKLDFTETDTLADGTVVTTEIHDDGKDHIVDSKDDGETDDHTANPGTNGAAEQGEEKVSGIKQAIRKPVAGSGVDSMTLAGHQLSHESVLV